MNAVNWDFDTAPTLVASNFAIFEYHQGGNTLMP